MSQREAHLADGTVLQFPEETTDEVMQAAVKRYIAGSRDGETYIPNPRQESSRSLTPAEVAKRKADLLASGRIDATLDPRGVVPQFEGWNPKANLVPDTASRTDLSNFMPNFLSGMQQGLSPTAQLSNAWETMKNSTGVPMIDAINQILPMVSQAQREGTVSGVVGNLLGNTTGSAMLGKAGGAAIPTPEQVRTVGNMVTSPESLLQRAAANRTAAMAPAPVTMKDLLLTSVVPAAFEAGGTKAAAIAAIPEALYRAGKTPAYLNWKAGLQEMLAQRLAEPAPLVNPPMGFPNVNAVDEPRPGIGIRADAPAVAAADEARRMAVAQSNRGPDVPLVPQAESPSTTPTVYRPHPDATLLPQAEAVPATETLPPLRAAEQAVSPSGRLRKSAQFYDAKGSPTRFGERVLKIAPDLATATKETAPAILTDGIRLAEQGINAAEDAIPPKTLIDTTPVADQISDLIDSYREAGNTSAVSALSKEWDKWAGAGKIPFETFRSMKRRLGEQMKSSRALQRAYTYTMDETSKLSTDLAEANARYSTLRRAADAGGIDIYTGRRISTVGK